MATYEAHRDINVSNNFAAKTDQLTWARALAWCTIESVMVFRDDRRVLFYNNKFGTLTGAGKDDLLDIRSYFRYLENFYKNASQMLEVAELPFHTYAPSQFELYHREGWIADCRSMPVLENYQLAGVVLLAHRNIGTPGLQNYIGSNQRG